MREIKFRAWDIDNKAWIYSDHTEGLAWFFNMVERYNCELMQFTGLKDRNFHEIYEGDIIRFECLNRVYSVECTNGGWNPFIDNMHTDGSYHYAIIGNIYENPELLE